MLTVLVLSLSLCTSVYSAEECASDTTQTVCNFGTPEIRDLWGFDPRYRIINHGAFGSAPKAVIDAQTSRHQRIESCPDCWFILERESELDRALERIAKFLRIPDKRDVVFVDNASFAVNAILRSFADRVRKQGSNLERTGVLTLSVAYPMVKHTLSHLSRMTGLNVTIVDVTREELNSEEMLLDHVRRVLLSDRDHRLGLMIVSHIVSQPHVILPIPKLARLAHEFGLLIAVDGAHSIGQIELDFSSDQSHFEFSEMNVMSHGLSEVDLYVSNVHKWLYGSRGVGVFYVTKSEQHWVYPPVISEEMEPNESELGDSSLLRQRFSYVGTNDDTNWMSVVDALDFRSRLVRDHCDLQCNKDVQSDHDDDDDQSALDRLILRHNHELCKNAAQRMREIWHSARNESEMPRLFIRNPELSASMMSIEMPSQLTLDDAYRMKQEFVSGKMSSDSEEYVMAGAFTPFEGSLWFRISCQVFNTLSDYEAYAQRVVDYLNRVYPVK